MPYSPTVYVNGTTPAINATDLNKLNTELKSQALAVSPTVPNTLPSTWTNGVAPAVSDQVPLNEMERVAAAVATSLGLSYTPTSWSAGWVPPRNAINLNHLENQAQANRAAIEAPVGTVYDQWSDLHSVFAPGDVVWVNHWGPPNAPNAQQSVSQAPVVPWGPPVNGAGSFEVTTPYGTGWRFLCHSSMLVTSQGKKSQNIDDSILRNSLAVNKTMTTHVMFPSGVTNTGWAPNNAWNDLIDIHTGSGADACVLGVNGDSNAGPVPSFYAHIVTNGVDKKGHAPSAFLMDTWYELKIEYNLTSAGTGRYNAYVDGVAFLTHSGPTITSGQIPYLQYGYYGDSLFYNEVFYGPIVIS